MDNARKEHLIEFISNLHETGLDVGFPIEEIPASQVAFHRQTLESNLHQVQLKRVLLGGCKVPLTAQLALSMKGDIVRDAVVVFIAGVFALSEVILSNEEDDMQSELPLLQSAELKGEPVILYEKPDIRDYFRKQKR